jgi:hypothetical protein
MGFSVPDAVMDKNLDEVALSDRLFLCSQQPATYAEAATTYNLATITLTAGDGNGDWTKGNGDVSGRKLTLAEQTGTGTNPGTANHVAFGVNGSSALKFVSTMTDFLVQAAVGFTLPSKDIWEIRDPA